MLLMLLLLMLLMLLLLLLLMLLLLLLHHLLHCMRMSCVMLRHHGRMLLLLPHLRPNRHIVLPQFDGCPSAYACNKCKT